MSINEAKIQGSGDSAHLVADIGNLDGIHGADVGVMLHDVNVVVAQAGAAVVVFEEEVIAGIRVGIGGLLPRFGFHLQEGRLWHSGLLSFGADIVARLPLPRARLRLLRHVARYGLVVSRTRNRRQREEKGKMKFRLIMHGWRRSRR